MGLSNGIAVELYKNPSQYRQNIALPPQLRQPVLPKHHRIGEIDSGLGVQPHSTRRLRYIAEHPGTDLQVVTNFSGFKWSQVTQDILIAISVHDATDPSFTRPRTHSWALPGGTQSGSVFIFRSAMMHNQARTRANNIALETPAPGPGAFTDDEQNHMTRYPVDAHRGCVSVCIQVGRLLPPSTNVTSFHHRTTDPPLASFAAVHNASTAVPIRPEWFTAATNVAQFHFRIRHAPDAPATMGGTIADTSAQSTAAASHSAMMPPMIPPAAPLFGLQITLPSSRLLAPAQAQHSMVAVPAPVATSASQHGMASHLAPGTMGPAGRNVVPPPTGPEASTSDHTLQSRKRQRSSSLEHDTHPAEQRRKRRPSLGSIPIRIQPIAASGKASTTEDEEINELQIATNIAEQDTRYEPRVVIKSEPDPDIAAKHDELDHGNDIHATSINSIEAASTIASIPSSQAQVASGTSAADAIMVDEDDVISFEAHRASQVLGDFDTAQRTAARQHRDVVEQDKDDDVVLVKADPDAKVSQAPVVDLTGGIDPPVKAEPSIKAEPIATHAAATEPLRADAVVQESQGKSRAELIAELEEAKEELHVIALRKRVKHLEAQISKAPI